MTLDEFNSLSVSDAAHALGACCGVRDWVAALVEARPFASLDELLSRADRTWRELGPRAWREAFAYHPRIGHQDWADSTPSGERAAHWSREEQSSVALADGGTRAALAEANHAYERRFGYIFLTLASGKTATQLLDEARRRLANEPDSELAVAAEEQRKITELRLRKMFEMPEDPSA